MSLLFTDKNYSIHTLQPIEWLLALLILVAPFYFHTNLGGAGLLVPNDIVVWLVATMIICYSVYQITLNQYLYLPRYFFYILVFPILVLFSSLLAGTEDIYIGLFKMLYIWGGLLFLLGVMQFSLKQGRIDRILFMIVLAGLLHALVGLTQIFLVQIIPSGLPADTNGMPTGLFQQINNHASFQTTSIIIGFWLLSRPFIRYGNSWQFYLLLISLCCSIFIVSYSGSRVATLGFLLALPLLLVGRWHFIKADKKRWWAVAILLLFSITYATTIENNRGLTSVIEKTTALNSGFSGSERLGIYAISSDLIKQKPLFGHGIGSFVQVWQHGKPAFYAEHPDASLPPLPVTHPHNEILLWLVEGGVIMGIGLLFVLICILLTLKHLPPSRRYAYTALLIPIVLHIQVELPFYNSASHWFVFLILLFVVINPTRRSFQLTLTKTTKTMIIIVALIGGIFTTTFLSHSMAASLEIKDYLHGEADHNNPLPLARENPYFTPRADHLIMLSFFQYAMQRKEDEHFRTFSIHELQSNPNILFYKLTIQAFLQLAENKPACNIATEAQAIYPTDKELQNIIRYCSKINLNN